MLGSEQVMNIFLSHASQDKVLAESIAFSLRSRGYTVFLDRDNLPAGESFDQQIERAVKDSEIFIFLISPDSVAEGRYSLTELTFARRKWASPNGRVLPIMARKTPLKQVPPYLKAVTILEPLGNIAAETSAAVDNMRPADDVPRHSWKEFVRQSVPVVFLGCLAIFSLEPSYVLRHVALALGFCSPIVKMVLPWSPSPEQKNKGKQIVDKVEKLRLKHWDPAQPTNTDAKVPTEVSWIKYFFQEDKVRAELLKDEIQEGHFLDKRIELSSQERSRLQGLFQDSVCKGDIEFWMSSQE
jgi:TIR domain